MLAAVLRTNHREWKVKRKLEAYYHQGQRPDCVGSGALGVVKMAVVTATG